MAPTTTREDRTPSNRPTKRSKSPVHRTINDSNPSNRHGLSAPPSLSSPAFPPIPMTEEIQAQLDTNVVDRASALPEDDRQVAGTLPLPIPIPIAGSASLRLPQTPTRRHTIAVTHKPSRLSPSIDSSHSSSDEVEILPFQPKEGHEAPESTEPGIQSGILQTGTLTPWLKGKSKGPERVSTSNSSTGSSNMDWTPSPSPLLRQRPTSPRAGSASIIKDRFTEDVSESNLGVEDDTVEQANEEVENAIHLEEEDEVVELATLASVRIEDNLTLENLSPKQKQYVLAIQLICQNHFGQYETEIFHRISCSNAQKLPISSAELIRTTININRAANSQSMIPADDVALDFLKKGHDTLAQLITNPFTYDVTSEDIFSSKWDTRTPKTGHIFYMRQLIYENWTEFKEDINAYAVGFPAKLPWCINVLMLAGASEVELQDTVDQVLAVQNVAGSLSLSSFLDPSIIKELPLRSIGHRKRFFIYYAGLTGTTTAQGRLEDDKDLTQRHYNNFLSTSAKKPISMAFRDHSSVRDVESYRDNSWSGNVEKHMISVLGLSLNEELGGWSTDYTPPKDVLEMYQSGVRAIGFLPYLDPQVPEKILSGVRNVLLAGQQYFMQRHLESDTIKPPIGEIPLRHTISAASTIGTVQGRSLVVTLADDTPQEQFFGRIAGPWAHNAGRALQTERHYLHLVDPSVQLNGDLDSEVIRQKYGGFIDVFSTSLPNRLWSEAVFFASSCIRKINPYVLITWSALNAHLVWKENGMKSVYGGDRNADVYRLNPIKPGELTPKQLIDQIGKSGLIHYGPNADDLALSIARPHPGGLKYDPQLGVVRHHLWFLVFLRTQLLVLVTRSYLGKDERELSLSPRYEQLIKIRERFEEVSQSIGLTQKMEEAKTKLLQIQTPIASLRQANVMSNRDQAATSRGQTSNGGMRTAPNGEERDKQMKEIIRTYKDHIARHAPYDTSKVCPQGMTVGSDEWCSWFQSLAPNRLLYVLLNTYGKTPQAMVNARTNREEFGVRAGAASAARSAQSRQERRDISVDAEHHQTFNLESKILEHIGTVSECTKWNMLHESYKVGKCTHCGLWELSGRNRNAYHLCTVGEGSLNPETTKRKFTMELFAPLHRVVFLHELLQVPGITEAHLDSIPNIKTVNVKSILEKHRISLPYPVDQDASIWVNKTDSNAYHQLIAALHVYHLQFTTVPSSLSMGVPSKAKESAIATKGTTSFFEWLRNMPHDRNVPRIATCGATYETCDIIRVQPPAAWYQHSCSRGGSMSNEPLKTERIINDWLDIPSFMVSRILVEHYLQPFPRPVWEMRWDSKVPYVHSTRRK
ncbi:hypothetical protein I302_102792 [Kwoniella bestiolae CBS 10118]|uniref:Uncharacterized protein n=1 Tax=Kwoniella bestiolae CBS 10118 TaxID=1296100 RepID=A0A1B9GG76_9TREE|nr:hypothetical protein I302_01486 [Kwoniella bestiolae CBS 10118]OCF29971.1 hypothetical protein I302_01486 [Kwoniella bestiolae CBS 10118]